MAALRVGLPVKTEKHHTFSSTAGARPMIPTILGIVIEEVRPVFAPTLTFFDPISSFATGRAIENLRENAPLRENAYNLVVCLQKATKLKT